MRFGHLTNNVVDKVIRASTSYIRSLPDAAEWREIPRGVGVGWTWSDPDWLSPDGGEPKPDPTTTPRYRKLVTPSEFVELFPPAVYLEIKNNLVGTNPVITLMYEYAFLKDTINLASPKLTDIAMPILLANSSLTRQQADVILQGVLEQP